MELLEVVVALGGVLTNPLDQQNAGMDAPLAPCGEPYLAVHQFLIEAGSGAFFDARQQAAVTVDGSTSRQPHANAWRSAVMRVARGDEFVHQRFNNKFVPIFVEVGEPLDGQIDGDIC